MFLFLLIFNISVACNIMEGKIKKKRKPLQLNIESLNYLQKTRTQLLGDEEVSWVSVGRRDD